MNEGRVSKEGHGVVRREETEMKKSILHSERRRAKDNGSPSIHYYYIVEIFGVVYHLSLPLKFRKPGL